SSAVRCFLLFFFFFPAEDGIRCLLWPVDVLVRYLVPILLLNVVSYLVPVQFLAVSQQVWSVDLILDGHYLVKVQDCCFRCRVALVLSIVPEHLEDLVHVFLSVWKLSPHYEVVYPPRNRSVRVLVKPHRCNSALDESSVFVCDRLSTPEHPV